MIKIKSEKIEIKEGEYIIRPIVPIDADSIVVATDGEYIIFDSIEDKQAWELKK